MMLSDVLRQYLLLFAVPRYRNREVIPDGSPILDCLAYGLSRLTDQIRQGDDIRLNDVQMRKLDDFDARVAQVAFSSKHWSSTDEWEGVYHSAWQLVEALGWDFRAENTG